MTYYIKFITDYKDININCFEYDGNLTIREMLLDFLCKTNSELILDDTKIIFVYTYKIINKKDILYKTISNIFRGNAWNIPIKVIETERGSVIKTKIYKIRFNTEDEELNNKIYEYNGKMAIKEMLLKFLSETNSKMTLNPEDIIFLYKAAILNKETNLSKDFSNIFKNSMNGLIRVIDRKDVIRGM